MKIDILYYILRWAGGFCSIIDGLCTLTTAGFYNPGLAFKMVTYSFKRTMRRRLEK